MKILSKIFMWFSVVFFACAVLVMGAHTFYSDCYFNAVHNYHNPVSQIISNDKPETSILLISDSGSHNRVLRTVLSKAMADDKYDFVMYMGDMTKNAAVTSYYWMLDEIHPLLNETPMYTIPGNHDITRRVGLSKTHFTDKSFYETIMGTRYYWFGYGDTLFITLDSSDTSLDDQQLAWLDNTLKKIRPGFKNCIIMGHVPPVNSRPDFFKDHITKAETNEKFEQIIKKYKVNAMFFGHVHFFSKGKFANIDFYTTPSSGQSIRDLEIPKFGYVKVNIAKNGNVKVEPGYVEFSGPKFDFFAEWFARDILSVKVRMIVSMALWLTLVSLCAALICRRYSQKSKRK